ncbi:MAG: integrase core domain-containing protein [Acidobacteriia bacterium]|nr:integrase core domain-containing protein [Terriglobia bacterium]
MKTLKQEEINGSSYRDLDQLCQSIAEFLENAYNRRRLHSALGYQSPVEHEEALMKSEAGNSTLLVGKGAGCLLPPRPLPPVKSNFPVPDFLVSL